MNHTITIAALLCVLATPSLALTIKKGEVIGGDGKVYQGASPEQQANLISLAKRDTWLGEGKKSGVQGGNLWLIVEDEMVFVPLNDLQGKGKDGVIEVVKSAIVAHLQSDLKAYYTQDGEFDKEGYDRDTKNFELQNDQQSQLIADEAARLAEYDAEAAASFIEANLDLATATDEASRRAAEAALEAAVESVSIQESIDATMNDLNIAEDLAREMVENNEFFRDDDGNYISRQEAEDRGYLD